MSFIFEETGIFYVANIRNLSLERNIQAPFPDGQFSLQGLLWNQLCWVSSKWEVDLTPTPVHQLKATEDSILTP